MTAALRQRRHRDRDRDGKIVLHVEVDHVALYEVLLAAGFINGNGDDRAALTAGLQRAVDIWCASRVTGVRDESW